ITDISGGEENYVCDFVIGTTTEFYLSKFKDALASTARARIYEIKLSPDETENMQNANWLLGENGLGHFLHFILRHLKCVRNCTNCPECNEGPFLEEGYNYYPFTKTFLTNLYYRLIREKDAPTRRGIKVSVTPRFIIQVLRNTLSKFVEESRPPSCYVDDSLIFETTDFFSLSRQEKEKFQDFLRTTWWYGNHSKDGNEISVETKTIQKLGIIVPPQFDGKTKIKVTVSPLRRQIQIVSGPISPDDVNLRANITGWCKGEGSQIALGPVAEGFNEVIKYLEDLSGSNNFRNVMNVRSSRDGESIEFAPPGQRRAHFWIGELKGDALQIYVMSKHKESVLKQFREKGMLILSLDEDDFFRLYKIGSKVSSDVEKLRYLEEILFARRDDLYDVLTKQKSGIRYELEKQLGSSPEAFVLSAYIFFNKLLKSQIVLKDIKEVDQVKELFYQEIDLGESDWSGDLGNMIEKIRTKYFGVVEDLFHSFYSLRGDGTIIDYPLLQKTWSILKNELYKPIVNVVAVSDSFILPKSRMRLNELVSVLKNAEASVRKYSKNYDDETAKQKIRDLRKIVAQISEKDRLVKSLTLLRNKLRDSETDISEFDSLVTEIKNLENQKEIVEKLDAVSKKMNRVKDDIDKAGLLVVLHNLGKLKVFGTVRKLNEIISKLEEETSAALDLEFENLKTQYLAFLELEKVF
ncbi:MAG: hypothetical protein QXX08_04290, partial [Candidatus Bathyarchaeia archaeon]